jgi:hypothetical protein
MGSSDRFCWRYAPHFIGLAQAEVGGYDARLF